ncbi:hypothetical protein D3C75_635260 [compost metagenome]
MAHTQYSPEEKNELIKAIKKLEGQTVSVATIAKEAGLNANRSRFAIDEMLEEGVITRTAVKAYNKNYRRYTWKVGK